MKHPDPPFADLLSAAIARRSVQRPVEPLTAYRVLNGPGDGAPAGLAVDRYADAIVVHAREGVDDALVTQLIDATRTVLEPRTVALKVWAPERSNSTSRCVFGDTKTIEVAEGDARILCDVDDGMQTGLFLDHRDTRLLMRTFAKGAEVLNAFAYTSAFSVHAALAGASRVTSVDVSKRSLARGRLNMEASGLDPHRHRWFADDVLTHLERGAAGAYDVIVLDPPLFGRSRRGAFSLLKDLDRLTRAAIRKLSDGGVLIFSTHALELTEDQMLSALKMGGDGRPMTIVERLGLPAWDHPVTAETDEADRGDYLKTLVLRFKGK